MFLFTRALLRLFSQLAGVVETQPTAECARTRLRSYESGKQPDEYPGTQVAYPLTGGHCPREIQQLQW
eukprot:3674507-Rhodomonas_salina.1